LTIDGDYQYEIGRCEPFEVDGRSRQPGLDSHVGNASTHRSIEAVAGFCFAMKTLNTETVGIICRSVLRQFLEIAAARSQLSYVAVLNGDGTRLARQWQASSPQAAFERDQSGMIVDRTDHRAKLPAVYNRYSEVRGNNPEQDDLRALLQPLLATSYLLFDWLMDNKVFGAEQIIVGSASSKTGLGLCKFLAEPAERAYRIVGLTSEANRSFVEGLGACDQVVTYDDVEAISQVPSVYVDMAGNADVKSRLHHHLGDKMRYSSAVGTSHWDKFAPPKDLPGAKPKFFFAPAQIQKRREEWGAGVIEKQITAAWKRLAVEASDWMSVQVHEGLAAATTVYGDLATGNANPGDGHIIRLV
jgi:hypothetical protein